MTGASHFPIFAGIGVSVATAAAFCVVFLAGYVFFLTYVQTAERRVVVKSLVMTALAGVITFPVIHAVVNFFAIFLDRPGADFADYLAREFESGRLLLRANTVMVAFPVYFFVRGAIRILGDRGDRVRRGRGRMRGVVTLNLFPRQLFWLCLLGAVFPVSVSFIWYAKAQPVDTLLISLLNLLTFLLIDDFALSMHYLLGTRGRIPVQRLVMIACLIPAIPALCAVVAFAMGADVLGALMIVFEGAVLLVAAKSVRVCRTLYSHVRLALQDPRYAAETAADALAALADRHRGAFDAIVAAARAEGHNPRALRKSILSLARTLTPSERILTEHQDRELATAERRLLQATPEGGQ